MKQIHLEISASTKKNKYKSIKLQIYSKYKLTTKSQELSGYAKHEKAQKKIGEAPGAELHPITLGGTSESIKRLKARCHSCPFGFGVVKNETKINDPTSHFCPIWVFPKIGIPQNGWFTMETLLKWMIWGYPYFRKHPYIQIIFNSNEMT